MRGDLFRISHTARRDPAVEAWFADGNPHRLMARGWFQRMRRCGPDVREAIHDGCPVACVGDVAFGYVNAFTAHASVGFFRGATLPDPEGLLEGTGKAMRHVKLRPGRAIDERALSELIVAAYDDIRKRKGSTDMKKTSKATGAASSTEAGDWRVETLARVRDLILAADPEITEEVKWRKPSNNMRGVPVWERDGIVCTGETYKDKVKLTFARGAEVDDPAGLFNASLDGGTRRAIDIREGEKLDERAFKALIRAAVALNAGRATVRSRNTRPRR